MSGGAGPQQVLVCDLNLPGIRGEDFCRTVLKHNAKLRVLLFSSSEEAEIQEAANRLGGTRWVRKQEGVARFLEVLYELMEDPVRETPLQSVLDQSGSGQRGVWLIGHGAQGPLELSDREIVLGRSPECDVPVPSSEASRRHCAVRWTKDGVLVRDLSSRNGTWVGFEQVQSTLVTSDAELVIGSVCFRLFFGITQRQAERLHEQLVQNETADLHIEDPRHNEDGHVTTEFPMPSTRKLDA